jgi:hypothetical protein
MVNTSFPSTPYVQFQNYQSHSNFYPYATISDEMLKKLVELVV